MPALTHSTWQQNEVGTGLAGQRPLAGPASAEAETSLFISYNCY